jgi:hypothetical protein
MTTHDTPEAVDRSDACELGAHQDCPWRCSCSCHARPPLLDLPDNPTEADRIATYRAALASGLSDPEAREEGWPTP